MGRASPTLHRVNPVARRYGCGTWTARVPARRSRASPRRQVTSSGRPMGARWRSECWCVERTTGASTCRPLRGVRSGQRRRVSSRSSGIAPIVRDFWKTACDRSSPCRRMVVRRIRSRAAIGRPTAPRGCPTARRSCSRRCAHRTPSMRGASPRSIGLMHRPAKSPR